MWLTAPSATPTRFDYPPDLHSFNRLQRPAMRTHPHPESPLRAEALGDLAIGIDAGEIDGPVCSVSGRETAGPLDRVTQIAERKHCGPHARPFRLRFARVVAVLPPRRAAGSKNAKRPRIPEGVLAFLRRGRARCAVPECRGISHADATFREALWDRFFTAAPRPRTPSELLYSDRRLRSKSSLAATILIRKR